MLGILHLHTILYTTSLIKVKPTNTMELTSIRKVIHNVVYKCDMTSVFYLLRTWYQPSNPRPQGHFNGQLFIFIFFLGKSKRKRIQQIADKSFFWLTKSIYLPIIYVMKRLKCYPKK